MNIAGEREWLSRSVVRLQALRWTALLVSILAGYCAAQAPKPCFAFLLRGDVNVSCGGITSLDDSFFARLFQNSENRPVESSDGRVASANPQ